MPQPPAASLYSLGKFGSGQLFNLTTVGRKVSQKPIRYGRKQQLADGNMVRDITAVKRTFSFHWDYLPHFDRDVLDGGIGYMTLYTLYQYGLNAGENNGQLTLMIPDGTGGQLTVTCVIGPDTKAQFVRINNATNLNNTVFWNVDLQLLEV